MSDLVDFDVIQKRADGLRDWLDQHAPECFSEQKHTTEGTQERVYWHYGYLVALRDIKRLLMPDEERCSHVNASGFRCGREPRHGGNHAPRKGEASR